MNIRFEDDLVEASVTLAASGACAGVSSLQIARFHREREKLYSILDPDDRNAAFSRLHLDWFNEWGLQALLTAPLQRFHLLGPALTILAYRRSRLKNDEGAELYVNALGERNGVICLRAERLRAPAELQAFLAHELMHLQDMIDPGFGYRANLPQLGASPSQQRIGRECYRLLWDVSIDGRLSAAGWPVLSNPDVRRAEFNKGFHLWPPSRQAEVFQELWTTAKPAHVRFEALIAEHSGLRCTTGPNPGAPCPLCGFPSFAWANPAALAEPVLGTVQREFPQWRFEQGLCRRCAEVYRAAVTHGALVV